MNVFSRSAQSMVPGSFLVEVPIVSIDDPSLQGWDGLSKAEQTHAGTFSARRMREWVAGRAALRSSLEKAGWCGGADLLVGQGGGPRLPDGFTGSVTHKDGLAMAWAAPLREGRTLGLDAEVLGRPRLGIEGKILRPEERERWRASGSRWEDLLSIFSLKEAIYKALYPHLPRYIGFEEAEVLSDGTIRMHLSDGNGGCVLRGEVCWQGERLLAFAEARSERARG